MANITNDFHKTLKVWSVQTSPSGYGHMKINVTLLNEETKEFGKFSAVTNCMPDFDAANNIEDYEEKKMAFFQLIAAKIEGQVNEWIYEIDNIQNNDQTN